MKGVRTPSDFLVTREKFVKPSLDSTTGAMTLTVSADDSANQSQSPEAHPQLASARSSDKTPRSTRCDI